jgi:hypothetical protein
MDMKEEGREEALSPAPQPRLLVIHQEPGLLGDHPELQDRNSSDQTA